jgi:hypothetical protein
MYFVTGRNVERQNVETQIVAIKNAGFTKHHYLPYTNLS